MIPGFTGHLISELFLESWLDNNRLLDSERDDIQRAFLEARHRAASLGPASSVRAILELGADPVVRALGFEPITGIDFVRDVIVASTSQLETSVAIIVARWGERLDPHWRLAATSARRKGPAWVLLFNGTHVRLVEAMRLHSRRYVELDLDSAADDARAFAALLALFHVTSFLRAPGGTARIEELLRGSERHAVDVCRALRNGVLEASGNLSSALLTRRTRGAPDAVYDAFEQALTIIYRILFLLFAEGRSLVPLWHPVYRDSYSLQELCTAAVKGPAAIGVWDALRASSRLAHAGCRAGDLNVTAFNGRLFSPVRTPLADRRDLDDEAARRALELLSTRPAPDRAGRERIAYRDLGVEQLGAVYEALLDYEPRLATEKADESAKQTRTRREFRVSLQPGSGRRKSSGSFYTPQLIARYLVRRTLEPLGHDRSPAEILQLRIVDPAMGSGAFLVAACSCLADMYERALVESGACHPSDIGQPERVLMRRTVAERCLYGVDLNPMAAELARLSLWLATLAADRPLSFLDHHLLTGDSLLGAPVWALGRTPEARRRRVSGEALLFDEPAMEHALAAALPVRFSLSSAPNDTAAQVHAKERALAALASRDTLLSRWKRVADLWCSHWFTKALVPSAFSALSDAILTGTGALPAATAREHLDESERTAATHRFFHWELEFPEVFFDVQGRRLPAGGFDAVIGNPPWDMLRADTGDAGQRRQLRRDTAATLRFTRDSGVYAFQSSGHPNRYQLFVERAVSLLKPTGRLGLILPAGLVADHGSASLRRLLFSRCAVDAIVGFDNRRAIFPIHRSTRFVLLTAGGTGPTDAIECRLGEHEPSVLESIGHRDLSTVRVTPALLNRLSGSDLSLPDLRSSMDLAIAERAATLFPPLADAWGAAFGRELNVTEDRDILHTAGVGHPVIEGKHVEPFRVHPERVRWSVTPIDAARHLGSRHRHARLAYRDVAGAGNRQTLIAAILPPGTVSTHTLFCLRTPLARVRQLFLCAAFNSFVVNYLVRLRVSTHVTTAIVERLPIPSWNAAPRAAGEIAALARVLVRGSNPGASARLNARIAQLYQLSVDEFAHILGTFPLVPEEERAAAMNTFRELGA
jgi:hypothetical protein